MEVYLVRHGQTEWNIKRRVQGAMDSPLTVEGIQQAENAAQRLRSVPFTHCYASPQKRAMDTAEIVARPHPGLTPHPEESLREFGFGNWEGLSLDEMAQLYPKEWSCYVDTPSRFVGPEGDSMAERLEESKGFVQRLVRQYSEKEKLLLVTHGYAIRLFVAAALGVPLEFMRHFRPGNTSITILDFALPHFPQISVFGDICHNQA